MDLEHKLLMRIERLEAQVKALSEHAGIPFDDGTGGVPPEVVELVRDGKKAAAMKRYQELTGADLGAASAAVSAIIV